MNAIDLDKPKRLLDDKFQVDLKNAENKYSCDCDQPALIGHEDADRIPKDYARCLNCEVLFRLR